VNKKIRYAIGAVGAVPALAMIPGQFAAPAVHAGKTAATTGKKVRTVYATDTAVFAGTSGISSASPSTSPNVGSCTGSVGHHNKSHDVTVRFYTRPVAGNRTCIGTIKVSDSGDQVFQVSGRVHNAGGPFCAFHGGTQQTIVTDRCRRVFRNDNGYLSRSPLTVSGFGVPFIGATGTVTSTVPFRNDGF
jgi:hypothetical protein